MTKRLFAILTIWIMIASFTLPCYTVKASIKEKEDSVTGDVLACFVRNTQWEEATVKNGKAVVTTDDGYTITVTGIPTEAAILRVFSIPFSETPARAWIADCIGEQYNVQAAFEIWFIDANGYRMNADGVQITIQKCERGCTIFSISTTSQTEELNNAYENGTIQFIADGSNYYALTKTASVAGKADSDNLAVSDKHTSPTTGDDGYGMLWLALASVSGYILIRVLLWWKRRTRSLFP